MSELFDRAARRSAPGSDESAARVTKWLVGDRLACVLLVGDSPLAYRLSAQGHEVVVVGPDVRSVRSPDVLYVRSTVEHLPFQAGSFDAVVAPRLATEATRLAEHARVLRPGGVVSSLARSHDESIPWVRRLRDLVGRREGADTRHDVALADTGLFEPAETLDVASWEELDLSGLLQYARETGAQPVDDAALARVRVLFEENTAHTGGLRLRHLTTAWRARVDKEAGPAPEGPPDVSLIDLA
ncbi:MAG: methyltransferase domain-containing protein [Actinomycetales bacterium]|nr:MAG: methyltransferase domain-containing protein [Actinomycetales bacterium]